MERSTYYLPIGKLPPHPIRWVIYSGNSTHNSWVRKSSRIGRKIMRDDNVRREKS